MLSLASAIFVQIFKQNECCRILGSHTVGYEVLCIMLCSAMKANRSFGGTCRLQFHAWRVSQARSQHLLHASLWFLAWIIVQPWRWRRHVLPKCQLTSNAIFQKIILQNECCLEDATRSSNIQCTYSRTILEILRSKGLWKLSTNYRNCTLDIVHFTQKDYRIVYG
jgi:hypothetical protein